MTNQLDHYRLLGRSGLRVSPLSLGTMTFGTDWGWGADEVQARRMFDLYVDRGGNFVDSANVYTNGTAERLLGAFAEGRRDRLVIATKYTSAYRPGDPNSGGTHRKSMMRSVEGSLARLRTDYIDLLYLHAWDDTVAPDEVMRAFDDLVRQGKVLHVGLSNTPAWQIGRAQTLAELRGWAPLTALQIEYNLLQRGVERELIPAARELGIAVVPWSPLASGVLAGKYAQKDLKIAAGSSPTGTRAEVAASLGALSERGLAIAGVVGEVARDIGKTSAQVALAWTLLDPAIVSPIIGARTVAQLEENLGALEVELPAGARAKLDRASAVERGYPYDFLSTPMTRSVVTGGAIVEARRSR